MSKSGSSKNKMRFDTLKDFFDEIDNNYEIKYEDEKDEKDKVTNSWPYKKDLVNAVKHLIEGFDININNLKIDIMGKDRPTQYKKLIGIFVLPKNHYLSKGVYLAIKKNDEDQKVRFSFTYSDKFKPDQSIIDLMDSFDRKYSASLNISDNALDGIAKDKINKFVELSNIYNFPSMKSGKTWVEFEIPNISSSFKEKEYREENNTIKNELNNTPSNFILYGPPGTGKTYKTVDIAAGIVGSIREDIKDIDDIIDYDEDEEINLHKNNTEIFNAGLSARGDTAKNIKGESVHFVTFHQNYSYEEFVGGLRPVIAEDKSDGNLQFEWKPGIFIKACARALDLARSNNKVKWEEEIKGEKSIEDWFLRECSQYNKIDYKFNEETPKVVLIIDEINRANISRVFGELITLIEDDKRIGGKHQLILTLPNGDKKFGVPTNLIIMGTMNTADKSLALLDVALRRRFEFKGLFPKEELIENQYREILKTLNENIRKMKGVDYQIGHSYFMGRLDEDLSYEEFLKKVFNKNVIPLLNEYFMNDREKIKGLVEKVVTINQEVFDKYGVVKCSGVKEN